MALGDGVGAVADLQAQALNVAVPRRKRRLCATPDGRKAGSVELKECKGAATWHALVSKRSNPATWSIVPGMRPSAIIRLAIRSACRPQCAIQQQQQGQRIGNGGRGTGKAGERTRSVGTASRTPSSISVMLVYTLEAERRLCSSTARSSTVMPAGGRARWRAGADEGGRG